MLARFIPRIVWLFLLGTPLAMAAPTVKAPAAANIGTPISVTVSGNSNPRDFVTIVKKGAPEGSFQEYQYVAQSTVELHVPPTPGDYEIRLLSADGTYPTLARQPLKANAVTVTLDAPAQVAAGATLQVKWTGPANQRDYIGLGNAQQTYLVYAYTRDGNPAKLQMPDAAGDYELRYFRSRP